MGRTVPTKENVQAAFRQANKFTGLKKGEKARILAIELGKPKPGEEFGPWSEWRHNLQAPEVKDAEGRTVRERKWFGSYLCLGEEEMLMAQGGDPENCPACRMAGQADEFKADRRHAMNIIVYSTKPGEHTITSPASVQCKVWVFSERVFAQLSSLYEEYEDLRKYDIMITCEVEQYQNYVMQVARTAEWIAKKNNPDGQPGLKDLVAETYKENRLPDEGLANECGARVSPVTLTEKCNQLAAALGLTVAGIEAAEMGDVASRVSASDLSQMMGTGPDPAEVAEDGGVPSLEADVQPEEDEGDDSPTPEDLDSILDL